MIYQDAIKMVVDGKLVTREAWKEEGGYLAHLPGLTHPLKTVMQPKVECRPWAPDLADSLANDWELYTAEIQKDEAKPA